MLLPTIHLELPVTNMPKQLWLVVSKLVWYILLFAGVLMYHALQLEFCLVTILIIWLCELVLSYRLGLKVGRKTHKYCQFLSQPVKLHSLVFHLSSDFRLTDLVWQHGVYHLQICTESLPAVHLWCQAGQTEKDLGTHLCVSFFFNSLWSLKRSVTPFKRTFIFSPVVEGRKNMTTTEEMFWKWKK